MRVRLYLRCNVMYHVVSGTGKALRLAVVQEDQHLPLKPKMIVLLVSLFLRRSLFPVFICPRLMILPMSPVLCVRTVKS